MALGDPGPQRWGRINTGSIGDGTKWGWTFIRGGELFGIGKHYIIFLLELERSCQSWYFLKKIKPVFLREKNKGGRSKAMSNLGGAMGTTVCTLIESYVLSKIQEI